MSNKSVVDGGEMILPAETGLSHQIVESLTDATLLHPFFKEEHSIAIAGSFHCQGIDGFDAIQLNDFHLYALFR